MARNPLHTRICDDIGCEFPVFAFSHCKDLIAAVTNTGDVGILGTARKNPDQAESDIRWLKQKVGGEPFGVDVLMPATAPPSGSAQSLREQIPPQYWEFVNKITRSRETVAEPKAWTEGKASGEWFGASMVTQEMARKHIEVALENRVPIFASALGSPAFMLEASHERRIKVFGLIGSVRQAVREAEAGVDYLVAQGSESGGALWRDRDLRLDPACGGRGQTQAYASGGWPGQ